MVAPSLVKWISGFTIFFALPLYFTKLIRETRFPEGMPFVLVYSWGLIAVVALPILLLMQTYSLLRGFKGGERGSLYMSALALCFGVAAECIFFLTRR
jgi:hypothetical protein